MSFPEQIQETIHQLLTDLTAAIDARIAELDLPYGFRARLPELTSTEDGVWRLETELVPDPNIPARTVTYYAGTD